MLYKWVREFVERYSFIKKTKFINMYVYFYYDKDGKEVFKRLPYRATKERVQVMIEKIREDINYYEDKKIRDEKVRQAIKYGQIMFARA